TRMPQRRGVQRYSAAGGVVVGGMARLCGWTNSIWKKNLFVFIFLLFGGTPPPLDHRAPAPAPAGAPRGGARGGGPPGLPRGRAGGGAAGERGAGLAAGQRGVRVAAADEPGGLPPVVNAWRSLAARHAAVTTALEHELGERHGLGVSEFEVLERLAGNDQHKFR